MNENLKSIQPNLDRLGAVAKLYYPECKIVRLRDRIILEKNAFISVQFIMDDGDLKLSDPHSASKDVWSILGILVLLNLKFSPAEKNITYIIYIVLCVFGLLFYVLQPRDKQWTDEAMDRVYRAYISENTYETETTNFRDSYTTVYKFGEKTRTVALISIILLSLFTQLCLLTGDYKIIISFVTIPFICILFCLWIYLKKTNIEYDERAQSIEAA